MQTKTRDKNVLLQHLKYQKLEITQNNRKRKYECLSTVTLYHLNVFSGAAEKTCWLTEFAALTENSNKFRS